MKFLCVLCVCIALVAGCGTTGQVKKPPPDWPHLSVTTVVVDRNDEFERLCGATPPGFVQNGCAVINFARNTCVIVLAKRRYSQWTIDEEQDHCKGVDHPGETLLKSAWEKHRRLARLRDQYSQPK